MEAEGLRKFSSDNRVNFPAPSHIYIHHDVVINDSNYEPVMVEDDPG